MKKRLLSVFLFAASIVAAEGWGDYSNADHTVRVNPYDLTVLAQLGLPVTGDAAGAGVYVTRKDGQVPDIYEVTLKFRCEGRTYLQTQYIKGQRGGSYEIFWIGRDVTVLSVSVEDVAYVPEEVVE